MTSTQRNWLSIGLVAAIAGAVSAYTVAEYRLDKLERKVDAIGCYLVPQSFECPRAR